tara:strand:+ start:763 stop:1056 length:294 start_codon:yes stop_codon:yes gene_type:complete
MKINKKEQLLISCLLNLISAHEERERILEQVDILTAFKNPNFFYETNKEQKLKVATFGSDSNGDEDKLIEVDLKALESLEQKLKDKNIMMSFAHDLT